MHGADEILDGKCERRWPIGKQSSRKGENIKKILKN
jgi:hypothetical protein